MINKKSMIPVQPYLMINADDYRSVIVQQTGVSHFYEFSVQNEYEKCFQAVPDGSTDLVFSIGQNNVRTYIGGTVLKVKNWDFEKGRTYFGVRFQPGKYILPKGIRISDVVNADIEINNQDFDNNLAEQIAQSNDIADRCNIFMNYYLTKGKEIDEKDTIRAIERYIRKRIYDCKGNITIKELAMESGYSECYIRRSFEKVHGISPKVFERFIRFQTMLNCIDESRQSGMEELAMDCGYYDQSHMMKDFKCFTGITPEAYRGLINNRKWEEQYYEVI